MPIKKFNSVYGFSVGDDLQQEVVDSNANVTANVLTVTSTSNLGSNSNVKITGGSSGQVLKTDGLGNLYWALDSAPAGGANTQIQFNNNGSLDGNSGFTYNYVTGLLSLSGNISTGNAGLGNLVTANYFSGDGRLLTNVSAVTSITAGTVTTNAQPNITSVGTLNGLTVTGTATFQNILVDGSTANFNVNTLTIKDGLIDLLNGTIGTPSQNAGLRVMRGDELAVQLRWNEASQVWQYTVDGVTYRNLVGVDSAGNVNLSNIGVANYFYGNGYYLTGISSASIIGQVANALVAGTVYTNAQPNITSVGTLSSLSVTSNISTGNILGNGYYLSGINSSNIVGQVANALVAGTVYNPNQPNITSVGTLSSLTVTSDTTIGGNLIVNGTTTYINVDTLNIEDPVIALGGGPNGNALTVNDGKDRGSLLHYYTTKPIDAFMGWDNSNAEFAFGSNVSVTGDIVTFNDFGNIRAGYFIGNGSQLTGVSADNAITAGTVTTNAQPNITSVGTLTNLNVSGNVSAGNVLGNGYYLSGLNGGNVLGQVGNSLVTGTVYTNAQPNITSVGTLTTLNTSGNITSGGNLLVTANVSAGNANLGTLATATYFSGDGSNLTNITGANVTGQVGNSLIAGTVYTNAQPNITSLGTLSTLNVTGNITSGGNLSVTSNISSGNANLGTLATATYFSGDGSNLTNLPAGTQIVNGTSNLRVFNNGNIALSVSGTSNVVTVTSSNVNITGNVAVSNLLSRDGKNVPTFVSQTDAPTNPKLGDQWYDTDNDVIYQYIYDGVSFTWVDTSSGYITSDVSATGNTLVQRDANANVNANYFVGNGATLGNLANVRITGGTASYVIQTDGAGNLSWVNPTTFTTTPAGSNTQLQFNDGGSFGGSDNLTFNKATNTFTTFNALINGNLTVNGTTEYTNVNNLYVQDPIIEMGGNANGGALTSNDGKDRGTLLHYYTTKTVDAFMGWDNSNAEFAFGSNVTVSNEVVTYNTFGNVRAGNFLGNGYYLSNIFGSNVVGQVGNALVAGTVYSNAQPNITSVGTLTSLTVSGNTSSGNVLGNGYYLSGLFGSNVIGQVANALVAGTVYNPAQPNITSVGTLTSLTVSGNVSSGGNVIGTHYGNGYNLFGIYGSNVIGQVANALVAGTVYNPQQPNITSVGTLTNLTVTSNVSAGNILGNGYYLSSIVGGNVSGQVSNALVAGTVYNPSQPNITSTGTLNGLTATGTVNFTGASNVSLGSNANVKISGGSAGYVLKTDGAGNLSWGIDTTAAGGSNTQIQFNDNGTLSATSDFTFDKTTKVVTVNGNITTANLTSTGLVNFTSASNVALGANSTVKITGGSSGQVLSTDGAGNLAWTSAASAAAIYVQSNIDSIVAGSALTFVTDYTNPSYPGGIFTLAQLGPVTGALTDVWTSSGTSTKNAYANFEAGTVLNSNINVTFTLANATFNIQSTDTITIGSTTITGANITGLGISGTGGTYTIANTLFATSVLTNSTSTVTANLTTNRGFKTYTGTTLNATQPVRFNVNSLSGSFGTNPAPYWTTTQTFNWSASLTAGASVISGNVTYSNTAQSISGTLTSSGATSGTSPSLNCALTYTISSSDYTGSGANGAGARVIPSTVNGTVNAVTFYYPLFYKTTSSSANPNFTTSDAYNANNFTTGQGANTTANTSDYLWIATPTTTARSWAYTFVGSRVDVTPDVTYTNQTISGQTYTVYGFTNYSAITFIYTV